MVFVEDLDVCLLCVVKTCCSRECPVSLSRSVFLLFQEFQELYFNDILEETKKDLTSEEETEDDLEEDS